MRKKPYQFLKLSNGLSLILQTMPSVDSAAVYVAVGAGSRYETKDTAGTAHFLEHMLFEGTKRLSTPKDVAEYIERVGGKSGAWTDKEYVTYYAKVPKQHLEVAFSYLAEILFNSTLSNKAIKKERGIVVEELRRKADNPEAEIWDLWFEWVWGKDQSLGRSILGYEETIKKITKRQLQGYMKRLYHTANMAIAVTGNFYPQDAKDYTFKYFGQKSSGSIPMFRKLSPISKKMHTKIIRTNTQQVQLILGFVTDISYTHKDRFTLRVIADILSAGVSSRLFQKLIYDLGIAYSAGAFYWVFADAGSFLTYGGFSAENAEIAIKIILEELKKIKDKKISDQELQGTKEKGKANIVFSLETPEQMANWYATQQVTEKRIMTIEETLEKIDEVTTEDIQRVARQIFISKNLYLTMRGSIEGNSLEGSEIVFGEFDKQFSSLFFRKS